MMGIHFSPVTYLWLQQHHTWNLTRRRLKGKRIYKSLIFLEAANTYISNKLELYNIFGDNL